MPTYEFRCPQGHVFEKFSQTMSSPKRTRCPTCGKTATRIISSGAGLVFKGSGFYITDYKRAGEKKEGSEVKDTKDTKDTKDSKESKGAKEPVAEKPKPKKDPTDK